MEERRINAKERRNKAKEQSKGAKLASDRNFTGDQKITIDQKFTGEQAFRNSMILAYLPVSRKQSRWRSLEIKYYFDQGQPEALSKFSGTDFKTLAQHG